VWKRSGTILVEWEEMKSKKIDEAWIRKGKKEKMLKDREEGGVVGKWRDKGGLPRAHTGPLHQLPDVLVWPPVQYFGSHVRVDDWSHFDWGFPALIAFFDRLRGGSVRDINGSTQPLSTSYHIHTAPASRDDQQLQHHPQHSNNCETAQLLSVRTDTN